jgi:hypothetical protein
MAVGVRAVKGESRFWRDLATITARIGKGESTVRRVAAIAAIEAVIRIDVAAIRRIHR